MAGMHVDSQARWVYAQYGKTLEHRESKRIHRPNVTFMDSENVEEYDELRTMKRSFGQAASPLGRCRSTTLSGVIPVGAALGFSRSLVRVATMRSTNTS